MLEFTGPIARNFIFALINCDERHPIFDESRLIVKAKLDLFALLKSIDENNIVKLKMLIYYYIDEKIKTLSNRKLQELLLEALRTKNDEKAASWEELPEELQLRFYFTAYKTRHSEAVCAILKDYSPKTIVAKDYEGSFSSFLIDSFLFGKAPLEADFEYKVTKLINKIERPQFVESRIECRMPTTKAAAECFIDTLRGVLTEKELLRRYGEKTLRQFIGRYPDPLVHELLKEKQARLEELTKMLKNSEFRQIILAEKEFSRNLEAAADKMREKLGENPERAKAEFMLRLLKLKKTFKKNLGRIYINEWRSLAAEASESETLRSEIE